MTPKLSIVTGTLNRPASFQRLIDSIIAVTQVSFEVVVSDASDTPDSLCIRDLPENVIIYPEQPRLGCTKAFNRAFKLARGKYALWVNDDVEVLRGYDTESIAFMEANPKIGLGALYYKEGARDFHVNAYFGMVYANFGIIRRSLGNEVGWFDEDIPMYGNDNSLAFKVLLAGNGVSAIQNARVVHYAIQDRYREEHGEISQRIRDVERLTEKYGPHMSEMRETYIRTGSTPVDGIQDQTPGFIREKVSG